MSKTPKEFQLVLITWEDSSGTNDTWANLDGDLRVMRKRLRKYGSTAYLVRSVGWITFEAPDAIHLTPHLGGGQDRRHAVMGDMLIPRRCIVSMHPILMQKIEQPSKLDAAVETAARTAAAAHDAALEVDIAKLEASLTTAQVEPPVDTSDISEADEAFFARASLVMPRKRAEAANAVRNAEIVRDRRLAGDGAARGALASSLLTEAEQQAFNRQKQSLTEAELREFVGKLSEKHP